jgi:hypothetical protein
MAVITIPDEDTTATFSVGSTPTTGPWTFPFRYFEKADLRVYVGDVELPLSSFSVSGGTVVTGGFIGGDLAVAVPIHDVTLTIRRDITPSRTDNFSPATYASIPDIDIALNRQMAVAQDVSAKADRVLAAIFGGLLPTDVPVATIWRTILATATYISAAALLGGLVTPEMFGATAANDSFDDGAAINAALATGKPVLLQGRGLLRVEHGQRDRRPDDPAEPGRLHQVDPDRPHPPGAGPQHQRVRLPRPVREPARRQRHPGRGPAPGGHGGLLHALQHPHGADLCRRPAGEPGGLRGQRGHERVLLLHARSLVHPRLRLRGHEHPGRERGQHRERLGQHLHQRQALGF